MNEANFLKTFTLDSHMRIVVKLFFFSVFQNDDACPAQWLTTGPQTAVVSMTITITVMATTIATIGYPRWQQVIGSALLQKRRPFAGSWNTSSWVLVINIMPRVASLISWSCSCSRSLLSLLRYIICYLLLFFLSHHKIVFHNQSWEERNLLS